MEERFMNQQTGANRIQFGIQELTKLVNMRRQGLITRKEYNNYRKEIESFLEL